MQKKNKGSPHSPSASPSPAALPSPPAMTLDNQLCFAIYGAAHAFNRVYKPLLEPLGLTYPQYLVMLTLWEENGQSVKSIGEKLGLDSGTLSPLLKRLEQSGLVARKRDREDERQVRIFLTGKGAEMQSATAQIGKAIGKALGCGLDEAAILRNEVRALRERLLKADT